MPMNLVQQRGEASVWDERWKWDTKSWLLGGLAGACLVSGIRSRSFTGLMLVLAGGALGWLAAGGSEERLHRRAQLRAMLPAWERHGDPVKEASEESFPASDAPSWTPTTGRNRPATRSTGH